jgi:hypothetical protein
VPSYAQHATTKDQLIGTWKVETLKATAGDKVSYPLGERPTGYVTMTPEYVDGFSVEQHKFGPFGPIRAKVKELATESGTASAGGPDNGSDEFIIRRAR